MVADCQAPCNSFSRGCASYEQGDGEDNLGMLGMDEAGVCLQAAARGLRERLIGSLVVSRERPKDKFVPIRVYSWFADPIPR